MQLLAKNMAADQKKTPYVIFYCLSFKIILCILILCDIRELVLYDIQDITVGDKDGICLNEEYNFGSDMATIGQIKEYVEGQKDFERCIERVEQFFEANEIDEKKRVAVLLTVIGAPTYGL